MKDKKTLSLVAKLIKRYMFEKNMNVIELSKKAKIPHQTLHQIVNGLSKSPHKRSLDKISKELKLSVEQLKGEKPLPENLWGGLASLSIKTETVKIPLISWEEVKTLKMPPSIISDHYVICTPNTNINCFALTMNDASMEPIFLNKSTLIFDPDKKPNDRNFVLALLGKEKIPVFRQLFIDINKKYLKSISPELDSGMKSLSDKDKIIATLVESRRNYDEDY